MRDLKYIILSSLVLGCFLAVPAWLIFKDSQTTEQKPAHPQETNRETRTRPPQHEIVGITYSTTLEGNSLFTLEANSIKLRKKRIGFLRFNMLTEAVIRNGVFHIYEPAEGNRSHINRETENHKNPLISQEIRNALLPPMPVKRIVSITSRPATLVLHHNDSTVTTITSSRATIGREKNEFIFNGNAKATSGNKALAADQLYVSLKQRKIFAKNILSFTSLPLPNLGGNVMLDLFLNPVNRSNTLPPTHQTKN